MELVHRRLGEGSPAFLPRDKGATHYKTHLIQTFYVNLNSEWYTFLLCPS